MKTHVMLALLSAVWAGPLMAADLSVDEIVNKANLAAYYQADDGKASVQMTITNKKGQKRERQFNILRKDVEDGGDQLYFVYFKRPSDVRKMAYLVHKHVGKDDDRWLHLPALSLDKRIAAGDKRTSFVGSDFLYEDVSGRGLEEDTHELIETTDTHYIVKNVPKDPDSVEFNYYTVAIDKKSFLPMKMEFYDKTDTLYRVIESQETQEVQGFPTVTTSLVKDLKSGSQTEMVFSDVKYDLELTADLFTTRYLGRPPREATR
ncbi:outer membrane lipoprotein-sorting protein [Planctomycetota bacterium]